MERVRTEAIERAAVGRLLVLAGGATRAAVVHRADPYSRQAVCGYDLRVDARFHTQVRPNDIVAPHELCTGCFPALGEAW